MIPRSYLSILVAGLPILVVTFAVLMAAAGLAAALKDPDGARVLQWVAAAALILLGVDVLLLLAVLGLKALEDQDSDGPSQTP